ncbi:nitrate reductase [Arthrobacter sp. 24S4-2]|uniref:purine-cytosine permease family protein n=1 Tax=Arthrobacter sp. 24S4-2 TaxID=2575374 RepID=UPI0010C7A601|nr:cytosine permease [Arthrobacter sp. 24S4-2]QCO98428.1 nitrate reductase [Arthrobacter sp. 24S4-2]
MFEDQAVIAMPAEHGGNHAVDVVGKVESRGIDQIPEAERHGRPRELFWVWFAANIAYLYFTLGGAVILLGLSLWQSVIVLFVGNLYWVGVGLLAISGPVSGTPSVVVTRAMFGIRGNRPLSAGVGWLVAICYEFINLAIGSLAGFALAERLGVEVSVPVKIAILLVTAVVTFTVSIYGHATIARLSPIFSIVLAVAMAVLGSFVIGHANFDYQPETALQGNELLVAVLLGISITAAIPLSWATGADYARYLPRTVSAKKVLVWTGLGGFLPSFLIGVLGVIAGTSIDMQDAQSSLEAILPAWFYPILLLVIMFSSMTSNILTAYSSGLCLQSLGIRMSRARTVFLDGLISCALAAYAIFNNDFLGSLSQTLELTVVVLAPSMAIYVADILLRKNRYDGAELHKENPQGRHWYWGGWSVNGVVSFGLGSVVNLLCVHTSTYQGPVSGLLGGRTFRPSLARSCRPFATSFCGPSPGILKAVPRHVPNKGSAHDKDMDRPR